MRNWIQGYLFRCLRRGLRLDEFCSEPPPKLDVVQVGEVVHYTLAGDGVASLAATDFVFAEVNREEIPRYVPGKRKRYMFAEVTVP